MRVKENGKLEFCKYNGKCDFVSHKPSSFQSKRHMSFTQQPMQVQKGFSNVSLLCSWSNL